MFYKPEIRKAMNSKRSQLDIMSIAQAAKRVAAQVVMLPEFTQKQTLAFYLPISNELDTRPLIKIAFELGKQLFLPTIPTNDDKILSFYSYHSDDHLIQGRHHIFEPDISKATVIDRRHLDIIFLPLLAFDDQCNRLGRGAGYYDYTLEFMKESFGKKPILIGLGYEFQKISAIEPSSWDVPLDKVVTESRIYVNSRARP